MSIRTIALLVQDEYVQKSSNFAGAAGSANAVTLELTFNDAWDGLTKKIYLIDALGGDPVYVLLGADHLVEGTTNVYRVTIPAEPLAYQGTMTMTIRGVTIDGEYVETLVMTADTTFTVAEASYTGSGPVEPTPTQSEQLQAQIDALAYQVHAAGFILGGSYNPETTYAPYTILEYENSSYVTIREVSGITPVNDGVNYQMMAGQGPQGDLQLGETETTAHRGDHGKTAYDHSQATADVHGAVSAATPGALMQRDAAGRAQVAEPVDDADIVNKGYVDDEISILTQYIDTEIANLTQVVSGSYVGTGTYNASNPTSITLPFIPDILIILVGDTNYRLLMIRGGHYTNIQDGAYTSITYTCNSVSPSWYITGEYPAPEKQLNGLGKTYRYLAVAAS